ncbi:MAG: CNNM domain-containing protein [Verrucomicrobiales bacterium]
MTLFFLAIFFTIFLSAFCSLLEAMILSTSFFEVEDLKRLKPKRGHLLETLRTNLEETSSAILTLNTFANTIGAVVVGAMATKLFGDVWLGVVSAGMTFGILILSEILPKNIGVAFRRQLQPVMVVPLYYICRVLRPITWFTETLVRAVIRDKKEQSLTDREITYLAERAASEGVIGSHEHRVILNALAMNSVQVRDVMTPRPVVTALEEDLTLEEVIERYPIIPFARMPVFKERLDDADGVVRRRDILQAIARGEQDKTLLQLKVKPVLVPEMVPLSKALEALLKAHQQLAIVLDEFGGLAGVVSIEDIVEQLLGSEIYEQDDLAVDMRMMALNRRRGLKSSQTHNNGAKLPQSTAQ